MGYGVWFIHNRKRYRLPINPEEIEETSVMAIEKYNVLKLGPIAVPANMELSEFSFEVELPRVETHYINTSDDFENSDYYINEFKKWRERLEPVRFIAASEIEDVTRESFNSLVLIEELSIIEKAGEEGDKYIKFKLLEYKNYSKKPADEIIYTLSIASGASKAKKKSKAITESVTPKSTGYYVVKAGDSLWSIAKIQYGDGSKCNILYNANKDKIKNPGLISIGWKLKIPAESEFSKYSVALPTTKAATKTTVSKNNSTMTGYEQGVAGIAALLEKLN